MEKEISFLGGASKFPLSQMGFQELESNCSKMSTNSNFLQCRLDPIPTTAKIHVFLYLYMFIGAYVLGGRVVLVHWVSRIATGEQ